MNFKNKIPFKGFTLLELVIVGVIVGILAVLGFSAYGGAQEQTFDREASTNLKMIQAAERVYALENPNGPNNYFPCAAPCSSAVLNSTLKLNLRAATTTWAYSITVDNTPVPPAPKICCAQAVRNNPPPGRARTFSIRMTEDEPAPGGCP